MAGARSYVDGMSPGTLMTAEELRQLRLPNTRTELVKGVLVVREPAGYEHGTVAMKLALAVGRFLEGSCPALATRHRRLAASRPSRRTWPSRCSRPTTAPGKSWRRSATGDGTESLVAESYALDGEDVLTGFRHPLADVLAI